jgi:putative hydrolase of the HAD superfamily
MSKQRPMIKAVIFDFGRVISAARPDAFFEIYEQELGIARGSLNRLMFESPAWQDALVGHLTMKAFWYRIGPSLGLTPRAAVDAFRRRYYSDEAINPEVLALIRRLNGRYRLAVLSNHPPGLEQWLVDWGIRRYFEVVYCSGDEGCAKPDPAAYQTTLDRLDAKPTEAIFVDDTAGHVNAARALGIHGIVFSDTPRLARELEKLGLAALSRRRLGGGDVTRGPSAATANQEN